MRKIFLLLSIICSLTFVSCESNKSIIEKCNETVKTFVANISLDNYDLLYKSYPTFKQMKRYWKIKDFKIENSSIDNDKTVTIIGTCSQGNVMFLMKKVSGSYVITNSKGLSSAFNTPIYKFCKEIGCIGIDSYDTDLSQICSNKEDDFNRIVYRVKNNIETNFLLKNNNLSSSYGYLSGDVTMKNYSRFTIPGYSYEIYYHFLNSSGNIVFTKKETLNYESIQYGQSITKSLYESNSSGFSKINVELKLTSTDFIERVVSENIKGNNCAVSTDF